MNLCTGDHVAHIDDPKHTTEAWWTCNGVEVARTKIDPDGDSYQVERFLKDSWGRHMQLLSRDDQ
jgi:hypothetical protein